MTNHVEVSLIIPTFNEEANIVRLLRSIKEQSCSNIETIVVDDASTDNTYVVALRYTKKVFRRKHAERSIQRNYGARVAKGKYLLFLDADMELTRNVIKDCISKTKNDAEIGMLVIAEDSIATTFWAKVKSFERSFYNLEGDSITEAARFFSTKSFHEAGGYDETITGPEDWDLPETISKLGYKTGRVETRILHHENVPNPLKLAKKKYYYGLKSYRYLHKHNINVVSAKTIYFLRPVFYKNWKVLFRHPVLTTCMFVMFGFELAGGGLGYFVGKLRKL